MIDKDRVYFELIKSKNEDTINCQEYIISEIVDNIDFYNKNGYIRIKVDIRKYPNCDIKKKWITTVCDHYLGDCEVRVNYCLVNYYNCFLTIKRK